MAKGIVFEKEQLVSPSHPTPAHKASEKGRVEEGEWRQEEPGCEWWSCRAQLPMPPWTCSCSSGAEGPAAGSSRSGWAHRPNREALKWGKAPGRDGSCALVMGTGFPKHEAFWQAPEVSRAKEKCVGADELLCPPKCVFCSHLSQRRLFPAWCKPHG